jgi:hypothetical protein
LEGGFTEWTKAGFPTQTKDFRKESCIKCHQGVSPTIVQEWLQSAHSKPENAVSCSVCHGIEHNSMQDIHQVRPVTATSCRTCHEKQFVHFSRGKHAQAWEIMQTWPAFHHNSDLDENSKDCTYCHSVGFKTGSEIRVLRGQDDATGAMACANCHTGHAYSVQQAEKPKSCLPCHQGQHTPQKQAYAGSPHGRLFSAQSGGKNHDSTNAPTCQTCHFADTMHNTQTAWGSLGLALPLPDDPQWAKARKLIMQGLGLSGPENEAGPREKLLAQHKIVPLSIGRWTMRRDRMEDICMQCHEPKIVQSTFAWTDNILRTADLNMAKALEILICMGREGLLGKEKKVDYRPDIGYFDPSFHPAEKTVYTMFHSFRTQAWQGAMHGNWEMAREGLNRMKDTIEQLKAMEAGE